MSDNRELMLTRLFDAPREKLYCAWTDPELLKQPAARQRISIGFSIRCGCNGGFLGGSDPSSRGTRARPTG